MNFKLSFVISCFIYHIDSQDLVNISTEEGAKLLNSIYSQLTMKKCKKWDKILIKAWEDAGFENKPSKKVIYIAEHFGIEHYV